MILDTIENATLYTSLSEKITKGLTYIQNTNLEDAATGKYDLGDNMFAIVDEYQTKAIENARPEAHEKFIDIQYIVKGEELIGFTPLEGQVPSVPYSDDNDVVFYQEETSLMKIKAGMFAIFFPADIHQPCVMISESKPVKKLVIKVPV